MTDTSSDGRDQGFRNEREAFIVGEVARGAPYRAIATQLGIHKSQISRIVGRYERRSGEKLPRAKRGRRTLTEPSLTQMNYAAAYRRLGTLQKVANEFDVSREAVSYTIRQYERLTEDIVISRRTRA